MSRVRKDRGFVAGTRVLCAAGQVPIEFIENGERLITRDAGHARVTDITRQIVQTRFVRFQTHSLDETGPNAELILPPDQTVLVRNWRAREVFGVDRALVKAASLVDDIFIEMTEPREEVVFQISFASPHVLYLEGTEVGCANAAPAKGGLPRQAEIPKSLRSFLFSEP